MKKRPTNSQDDPRRTLNLESCPDADRPKVLAQTVLRPSIQAAATLHQFKLLEGVELTALVDELAGQAKLASSGNLERAEAMLILQAHTLDAIFNNLARKANGCEYLSQFEAYLRLGLKAQSQCRAALETLAVMKNPAPVAFVRQANIAHGPQQVNNTAQPPTAEASRARECENQPNKLLEQKHNEWQYTRATQATIGADPTVEAVGPIDRTAHRRG